MTGVQTCALPISARRRHRDVAPPVPRPGDAAALRPQLRRHSLRRLAGGHFRELPMTRRFSLLCIAAVALVLFWGGAAHPLAPGPVPAQMIGSLAALALAAPAITPPLPSPQP